MSKTLHELAECLLEIEAELRRLDWWSSEEPCARSLASTEPFCVDTMAFEQWLQWVFLPRMKQLLEQAAELPQRSAITEMAEMVYAEMPGRTVVLRRHLKRVDRLLERNSRTDA